MKEYLEQLKRFLTETTAQLGVTTDAGIVDKLIALKSQLVGIKNDIEVALEKQENIVFGMFAMKNRVDIVDDMPLSFEIGGGLFLTKANVSVFKNDLNNFCKSIGLGSLEYFYYDINELTNSMTFYFAVRSALQIDVEIALLIGVKKYTFGKIESNKFFPRFDNKPPIDLLTTNNRGFGLSYNITADPGAYIDRLFAVTAKGGELADLRFLKPSSYSVVLQNLILHFKSLKWLSIMTQEQKFTLLPDGTYKVTNFK